MPLYTYKCDSCGKPHEAVRTIDTRHDSPICCGTPTRKTLNRPFVRVFTPYRTVALDQERGKCLDINSIEEHQAFLRRNGYEEVGDDPSMAPPPVEEVAEKQDRERKELAQFSKDYTLVDNFDAVA